MEMVQFIVGQRGKGKTKQLIDRANKAVAEAKGTVDFLDRSSQHMYELNNKVRLINVNEFQLESEDEFVGFISGIISQDHDLEYLILDSFLKLASLEGKPIGDCVRKLDALSEKYKINIISSLSMDKEDVPLELRDHIAIAL